MNQDMGREVNLTFVSRHLGKGRFGNKTLTHFDLPRAVKLGALEHWSNESGR